MDRAIVEYEKLVTFDPEEAVPSFINPKYYYRLGLALTSRPGRLRGRSPSMERFLEAS